MTIIDSILVTSMFVLVISLATCLMALLVMVVGMFVKHRWIDDILGHLTFIRLTTSSIFTWLLILWGIMNLF